MKKFKFYGHPVQVSQYQIGDYIGGKELNPEVPLRSGTVVSKRPFRFQGLLKDHDGTGPGFIKNQNYGLPVIAVMVLWDDDQTCSTVNIEACKFVTDKSTGDEEPLLLTEKEMVEKGAFSTTKPDTPNETRDAGINSIKVLGFDCEITNKLREIAKVHDLEVVNFIVQCILIKLVPKFKNSTVEMPGLLDVLQHGIFVGIDLSEVIYNADLEKRIMDDLTFVANSPNMKLTKINFRDDGIVFPENVKAHSNLISQYEKEFTTDLYNILGSRGYEAVVTSLNFIYSITVVESYRTYDVDKVGLILKAGIYNGIPNDAVYLDSEAINRVRHYFKQPQL